MRSSSHTWLGHLVRRLFIVSTLATPALAQLDTQGIGMSDIWQRHFNQGNLFDTENPDHAPAADPDGDGWTNLIESFAGTDPFDNHPPQGIVPAHVVHLGDQEEAPSAEYPEGRLIDIVIVSWDTLFGKRYTLMQSPGLAPNSWLATDIPQYGEGQPMAVTITLNQTGGISPDKFFWRVAIDDFDTDEDGLTDHDKFILGSNPYAADTSGDGIPDFWLAIHGLNPTEHHGSILFPNSDITAVAAYQAGVQAHPDATPNDLDGDGVPNEIDAVPDDHEIDWERTLETRYVWIEQVEKTDAKALSKCGHILFPRFNDGINTIAEQQVLWDSDSSAWIDMPPNSVWPDSGLEVGVQGGNFDAPWEQIIDMNDEGTVIGVSNNGAFASAGFYGVQAAMQWDRATDTTNSYQEPTYLVPSAGSGGNSFVDALINTNMRISDTGTISAACAYWNANTNEASNKWYVKNLELGQHSNTMTEWGIYPSTGGYKAQAILNQDTGLFNEYQANSNISILYYRNDGQAESLAGLIAGNSSEILDSDIARTPPTQGSPGGRVWFSVDQAAGDAVFLEKRVGGSGPYRWHNPPSMAEGALRLNARGEAITSTKVWRNGRYIEINQLAT